LYGCNWHLEIRGTKISHELFKKVSLGKGGLKLK
jgi:hypothetical protein